VKPGPDTHTICTEVSSSVPHFLQIGILLSPITYKYRLRVSCPERPVTTLYCVLLKDNNRALVAKLCPEIIKRWMDSQHSVMWRGPCSTQRQVVPKISNYLSIYATSNPKRDLHVPKFKAGQSLARQNSKLVPPGHESARLTDVHSPLTSRDCAMR